MRNRLSKHSISNRGEVTRQCGPGDIITVSGVFLTVKYSGYRAITAGLQADTFLEAFRIDKQKLNFGALLRLSESEAMVYMLSCYLLIPTHMVDIFILIRYVKLRGI